MALMMWNESLSVGIPLIDEQHKVLFAMINELAELVTTSEKHALVPSIISRLVDYTKEHFAMEEARMSTAPEQHSKMHKTEHDSFITKVEDYKDACSSGYVPYVDILEFLKDYWLVHHINTVDKELAMHIKT